MELSTASQCTVNGTDNHDFVVDVEDNGNLGTADTFAIQLSNGYSNGYSNEPEMIIGGNIQVH